MKNGTAPQLKQPLPLFILAGLAFAFCLFFRLKALSSLPPLITLLAMFGFLLTFIQNKVSWMFASSWIFLSSILLTLMTFNGELGNIPTSTDLHIRLVLLAVNVIYLVLMLYYFRYPYVPARTAVVGYGERMNVDLQGIIKWGSTQKEVQVVDLSSSGLAFKTADLGENSSTLQVGQEIEIQIQDVNHFKSRAEIVRVSDDLCAIRLKGWTPQSAFEHAKVLKWIRQKKSILKSEAGFSLAEAMVIAGLASIVVLGISQVFTDVYKASQQVGLVYQIQSVKEEIATALRNRTAWENTYNQVSNTGLDCVRNKVSCTGKLDAFTLFNVYDQKNNLLNNSLTATSGYSPDGRSCNQFNAADGNDQCPFRIESSVRAICETGTNCRNPSLEVFLKVIYKPKFSKMIVNESRLATHIYKDAAVDTLKDTCINSLGGDFDDAAGECILTSVSGACPHPGEYLTGLNNGQAVCATFQIAQLCAKGKFLRGFDADGKAVCGSI